MLILMSCFWRLRNTNITWKGALRWLTTLITVIFNWAKGIFHARFFSTVLNHGKTWRKLKVYTKNLGEVKNMELLHGLYNNSKSTATGIYIFKFSSLPSEIYCWNTLIKRNTVLCHHHFMETVIRKSFLRLKLLPGSFSHKTYQVKSLHQNKKKTNCS